MIKYLMDYLRIILFVCGVLIGIQVPGFVDQYGQRLEAHQLEAKLSLAEFQRDADRFFGGDFNKLISHYRQNNDPVVNAGGESIESIYQRYVLLTEALTQFRQHSYSPYQQLILAPQQDIQVEVWKNYSHVILLKPEAIAIGMLLGLLFAVLCESILSILYLGCRKVFVSN
ncbi:DUF2937 family protein [Shewanella glacialimarina]|jgi:hypothetical protein|uniref:DUF2937 family protein n=1 Tax=Shewanella glacialimarina TaxID=2590884 RepID=UPI001CF8D649|nr:DUF2937 family protein [Shewanella glacialimarina]UCX03193.1 DUF2937 family protein [Shewanella glacialimarina]